MGDFAVDTQIEGGDGRYRAVLSRDWEIWGPNGGYVAAIALRAAGREAAIPRPSSFAAHFLGVAKFAPVEIEVMAVQRGRRAESLRVAIAQEGRPILEALVRTARDGEGLVHDATTVPAAPDPETLPRDDEDHGHAFWRNFDCAWVAPARDAGERIARPPYNLSWHRFRPRACFDDPFVDAARALLLLDTLSWPAACGPHVDSAFIAPNLDVTAWFHRAEPASDWLLVEHSGPVAEGGLMGTTGRVYSRSGRLLASGGAQLFCVPAPPR